MNQLLTHWFWPNPGGWSYGDPKVQAVLAGCVLLIALSFGISYWRKSVKNPVTRKLSSSWSGTVLGFGIAALILAVSRVEIIQFISMRALWVVWALSFVLYGLFQLMAFRNRHYVVLEKKRTVDGRDKYLPRKKK
jgi:uncharacterized membrane protein